MAPHEPVTTKSTVAPSGAKLSGRAANCVEAPPWTNSTCGRCEAGAAGLPAPRSARLVVVRHFHQRAQVLLRLGDDALKLGAAVRHLQNAHPAAVPVQHLRLRNFKHIQRQHRRASREVEALTLPRGAGHRDAPCGGARRARGLPGRGGQRAVRQHTCAHHGSPTRLRCVRIATVSS